jgi:hypothetical protein
MSTLPEFTPFPKIPRLSKPVVITEKIDGTNALVYVTDDGDVFAGSRSRWITPQDDNFGFARWVEGNKDTLLKLGPGRHFGEWWGSGIQRNYGLKERRFSLFNVHRWAGVAEDVRPVAHDPKTREVTKWQTAVPEGIYVVPVLAWEVPLESVPSVMELLAFRGSYAAPGFNNPEGVVVFHTGGSHLYKVTFNGDKK